MHCNQQAWRIALLVTCAVGVSPVVAQETLPGVDALVEYLGIAAGDAQRLRQGEVIEIEETLKEGSDKEMAVSVAAVLPTTVEAAVELMRSGRKYAFDQSILEYARLSRDAPSAADFEDLGYTADEIKEVQNLLKVKMGSKFNLSAAEVDRFQSLAGKLKGRNVKKDPSVREAVNAEMRAVLLERLQAYRTGGLEAVEPYTRGKKKQSSPGQELTLALNEDIARDERLAPLVRQFQQALMKYPEGGAEGIENDFFWAKTIVQGRPCFVLAHVMTIQTKDGAILAERQFYVGHNYNSLSIVMGALPVERGTGVFYRNRTFTDQVAGFGSGAKKGIGRGQMQGTVVKLFREAQRQLKRGEIE